MGRRFRLVIGVVKMHAEATLDDAKRSSTSRRFFTATHARVF
jgi:hypothetical protein